MTQERLLLIGCGILQAEVRWLTEKNHWPVDMCFLSSALHMNLDKLSRRLREALETYQGRNIFVFYGCCHPLMEKMLMEAHTFRTIGQNCVDMVLGYQRFMEELGRGAFFLFEEWACTWNSLGSGIYGTNPKAMKCVFQLDHKYLLCIRTPCSGNFEAKAEEVSEMVGLPLRWADVTLERLESVLQAAITRMAEG
jgi:hypothetical protein